MRLTFRVGFIKQPEHTRIFYVAYKIVLSNLQLDFIILNVHSYLYGGLVTSPLSFAMDLTSLRCSSLSSMPYSSHMTMYSSREIVPSPPVSALSKSSHKADLLNQLLHYWTVLFSFILYRPRCWRLFRIFLAMTETILPFEASACNLSTESESKMNLCLRQDRHLKPRLSFNWLLAHILQQWLND